MLLILRYRIKMGFLVVSLPQTVSAHHCSRFLIPGAWEWEVEYFAILYLVDNNTVGVFCYFCVSTLSFYGCREKI